MALFGFLFFFFIIIGLLQYWLSSRRKDFYGLIIPYMNLILSTVLAMMTSTIFVAMFVFLLTLSPIILWIGIYKLNRFRVAKKIQDHINMMKIKDLG